VAAGLLSLLIFDEERKVRTPKSSITGNTRLSFLTKRTSATESTYR